MSSSPPIFLLTLLFLGLFGASMILAASGQGARKSSLRLKLLAASPAVAALALFYSLAIHMHASLGGWPDSIGSAGFPSRLAAHAEIAAVAFGGLLLVSLLLWPIAAIMSASVDRLKHALPHLGLFAVSCSVCFAAMLLAPSGFLYWWWD